MVYSDGADISSRFSLRDGETLIGRAQDCSIVLNVPNVSRHHARLKVAEGRCSLRDESTFGTHVNGSLVHNAEVPLKDGDVFQCGAVLFNLEQDAPPEFLSEEHQLLQDAHSIVRPIDGGLLPPEPQNAESRNASTSTLSATSLRPERRKGGDRRQTQQPLSGPERRAGRDRRQLRFLRLLSEISSTLVAVLPLPQVLSRVVDLVFEVVPAERVFLLLRDSADEAITPRVQRARDGSMPDATLSRTIVTKVLRERVAMLADDARYDSRLDGSGSIHAMLNVRSFMCAPLWNRQDVIGVLYADNPKSKRFIPEDLDVFTAIANYAAVAIEQARVAEQLQNEMRKRERLQRYHSPSVVNRIIGSTDVDAAFAAQERDLTVMFVDLVSFTKRSEHMNPLDVSKLLNHFFASMAEHIFELDGTLDKFIGDAILAVFGAPFSQEDHADRAIESALAMRQALREMNQELGSDPLSMRIALNSGIALTGDIGSPRRREFTVLGDVVNTCSRLQSSVCEPDQIVCTRATLDRARKAFKTRALGSISVRGREGEVEVFEIR